MVDMILTANAVQIKIYTFLTLFLFGYSDGRKTKKGKLVKGKAIYRIRGSMSDPKKVFDRAKELCKMLDNGYILQKKSETVK